MLEQSYLVHKDTYLAFYVYYTKSDPRLYSIGSKDVGMYLAKVV